METSEWVRGPYGKNMLLETLRSLERANEWVAFLNSVLAIDKSWLSQLLSSRLSCNYELARHPSIQVAKISDDGDGEGRGVHHGFECGFLGLLNGYLGVDEETGWGPIQMQVDSEGQILKFEISQQWRDKESRELEANAIR